MAPSALLPVSQMPYVEMIVSSECLTLSYQLHNSCIEPHPADCLNCRQAEHRMRRLIVGTSAEATHVGRLCFGCPECSRLALGGRQ